MDTLRLGVEVRDFDLERLGFSLSVVGEAGPHTSEGYLRMTLSELSAFLSALRSAGTIEVKTVEETAFACGSRHNSRPGSGRTTPRDHGYSCMVT